MRIKNVFFKSILAALMLLVGSVAVTAQPWTYNFGTGTGTHPTNSTSLIFLNSTPTNGGIYRVRTGTGGGTMILANPGTSLGDGSELQINASTSTSSNKFGVYDWNTASTVAYVKWKYRTTSSTTGNLNFSLGVNTLVSDNQGYTSHYNNSLVSFTITYSN